jgi:hypothetical protein
MATDVSGLRYTHDQIANRFSGHQIQERSLPRENALSVFLANIAWTDDGEPIGSRGDIGEDKSTAAIGCQWWNG